MPLFTKSPLFVWSANDSGLAIRFSDPKQFAKAQRGVADESGNLGLVRMQMLAECGDAEVGHVQEGIYIASTDAVRLAMELREGFLLPPPWPGGFRLQTQSVPQSLGFKARLGLVDSRGEVHWTWKQRGPILEVGTDSYLPTAAQYAALFAFQKWQHSPDRSELQHLCLLGTLREAHNCGCRIDLEAYNQTLIVNAREISVDARKEAGSGDLILRPIVSGDFPKLTPDDIESRLGQVSGDASRAVLRVGKTIVLLDENQTRQARALAVRGRVPHSEVKAFARDPSIWMAEHVFPDIKMEFSPRVTGVGHWKAGYAGSMWDEGEDWFGKKPTPEKKPAPQDGQEAGPESVDARDGSDEPEEPEEGPVVPLIIKNDEDLKYGWRDPAMELECEEPNFDRYARKPMEHQRRAVVWLLKHAHRALNRRVPNDQMAGYGAGALFADDMGLGKTFSTLIFLREWIDLWRTSIGGEPPAVLIVAPLSLLENWKVEIAKSYGDSASVFRRVLVVQSDSDLHKVCRSPGSRDVAVPGAVIEYGLGFGDASERSVDLPGSCVLTTYQTLRDYRFSFAKAEWSAAIFDEAQNIKNPNALQTIAVKSLKALFRLTLTGTPVENHLGDFWSILDASEPGPLGSFAEFRKNWIAPMIRERELAGEIGMRLRDKVGDLMLRRMKEQELTGLLSKQGHNEVILVEMTAEQVAAYDTVIANTQPGEIDDEARENQQNRQLAALWQLRQISLHPDLLCGGSMEGASNAASSRKTLQRSGKLGWLVKILDEIQGRSEKALVFCVQKKLQEALARHLAMIYGLKVPIINGDTKATSHRHTEETRLGLIDQFSRDLGFGVCILSPIAAGAGLNIVAANHVIHLERHWNPAKEDQATDRAHRIGQTRPVTVYLPAARHPNLELRSFDEVLHGLIAKKKGLQSALGLIPPESVKDSDFVDDVFGRKRSATTSAPLDLTGAMRLSWKLFEALIAELYSPAAQRVILTPGGSDQGCDVVVLGWGDNRINILIQCKTTCRDELDSEVAVREIEGARPFYEKALGIVFGHRCLHTTARRLSKRTLNAARICGVSVRDRSWLAAELKRKKVCLAELLARDVKRERI